MNIAIVGCGYVADFYLATLPRHPELRVRGVFDLLPERALSLSQRYGVLRYDSMAALLGDEELALVLNLTNPRDHFMVSQACLKAGKHVYSEKPIAMEIEEAKALVALAEQLGLRIVSAPCSVLGETAQALRQALREEVVGRVRVVYAEMDDGLVTRMQYRRWHSDSGIPWPYKDEFEVGCTLEHAGYYLSWLIDWFGKVDKVTAFSSIQVPDKVPGESLNLNSPDLSVACINFANGVVARLTCSILAPHDHSLRIVGDRGVLYTKECWDYRSPVYVRRLVSIRRRTFLSPLRRSRRLPPPPKGASMQRDAPRMDYARGPADMAHAIGAGVTGRMAMDFSLHVNELALAIHHSRRDGATYQMTTPFNRSEYDI